MMVIRLSRNISTWYGKEEYKVNNNSKTENTLEVIEL